MLSREIPTTFAVLDGSRLVPAFGILVDTANRISEDISKEQAIEIDVPVRTAHNQWTPFEDFPRFMEGVKQVAQIDDKHLYWKVEIGGTLKALSKMSEMRWVS